MRTSSDIVKIALVGVSGSGKTTCGSLLEKIVKAEFPKYKVVKLNVALPLHQSQAYIYRTFGQKNSGQDGGLLQFLAGHFEKSLGKTFSKNLERILARWPKQKLIILNTDCRNNAYSSLKKAGFVFIKIEVRPRTIVARLGIRGDLSTADLNHPVERIDRIRPNYVVDNNGSLADLESKLLALVRRIFRLR